MNPSTATSVALQCLYNEDIFRIILDSLDTSQRKSTLASLARVCKPLHETSTAKLWHSLDSFRPLLRLLPTDSWKEEPYRPGSSIIVLTIINPPPAEIDWTRFKHYARYVQRLKWYLTQDFSLDSLDALLARHPPTQPLLPQLRTLIWMEHNRDLFTLARFFLTPTLQRLRMNSFMVKRDDIPFLMNQVGEVCKNLEYLLLEISGLTDSCSEMLDTGTISHRRKVDPTDAVAGALSPLLHGLSKLQLYSGAYHMSAARTEALAALPRLKKLELDIKGDEMKTVAATALHRDPCAGPWFSALKTLWFTVDKLDENTRVFLAAIQSSDLQLLVIKMDMQPETSMLQKHLAAIARAPYRDSLTTLELFCDDQPGTERQLLLAGKALQPLYALPRIHTVVFRNFVLAADPGTLCDIANAWPQLEVLALACIPVIEAPLPVPRIGLADLVPLALKCPRLRALDVELWANEVPDEAALAQLLPAPSQSTLQHLAVNFGPILDPPQVADFLARVFPELKHLMRIGPNGPTLPFPCGRRELLPSAEWQTVGKLLAGRASSASGTPLAECDERSVIAIRERDPFLVFDTCFDYHYWIM